MKKPVVTNEAAAAVLEHHFRKRPGRIKRLSGGLNNYVFEARVGKEDYVVRISDEAPKLQQFLKEQWAVRKARAIKVPAPEILEVGNTAIQFPYMISVKVSGADATLWPDRLGVARSMGEYAAKINSIRTHGFGNVFDWSRNELSRNQSWKEFLDDELDFAGRIELFAKLKMMTPACLNRLRGHVKTLRGWKSRPALTHGDIRFKNVILDENGKIRSILDWENCTSNMVPFWELSIALHDLPIDEKEAFLEGYGVAPKEFLKMAPLVKTLNILNYTGAIQSALRDGKKGELEVIRARLHGGLDLHSL